MSVIRVEEGWRKERGKEMEIYGRGKKKKAGDGG